MAYNKKTAEQHLDNLRAFHGKRDSEEKRAAVNPAIRYLQDHFELVTSDAVSKMEKSEYRDVLHELVIPKGQRGNLSEYAGQRVHIVFISKDRSGRQSAYIRKV